MRKKTREKLIEHFDKYFCQKTNDIIHNPAMTDFNIDVLFYEPNEKYPFYKLVTLGASDYKLKGHVVEKRNEYMIFVDPSLNLRDKEVLQWYYQQLIVTARFPFLSKESISYGHTIDFQSDGDMQGVLVMLPQIIEDVGILRCPISKYKRVACLQVMPITKEEMDAKLEKGAEWLEEKFYPIDEGELHYLAEKTRSF